MRSGICVGGPKDGEVVEFNGTQFDAPIWQPVHEAMTIDDGALVSRTPPRMTYVFDSIQFGDAEPVTFWRDKALSSRDAVAYVFRRFETLTKRAANRRGVGP